MERVGARHLLGLGTWNMARGMRAAHLLAALVVAFAALFRGVGGQDPFNDLTGFSLSPPYFNIVQGSKISATATCGQDEAGAPRHDLYCKLVGGPTAGVPTQNIQVRKSSVWCHSGSVCVRKEGKRRNVGTR